MIRPDRLDFNISCREDGNVAAIMLSFSIHDGLVSVLPGLAQAPPWVIRMIAAIATWAEAEHHAELERAIKFTEQAIEAGFRKSEKTPNA